ncbi:hypothetical protein KKE60_06300 [Patescibacteria group bacterium]|nr:hypothetical protein [Patescibacteria group bacterium]
MSDVLGKVRGRFSRKEDDFIRQNYQHLSDKDLAASLNREVRSITNRRVKLDLIHDKQENGQIKQYQERYRRSLTEEEKRASYTKELKRSALYRETKKVVNKSELIFYEEQLINFLMDPTIETMTVPERDALHEMTIAQIIIFRLLAAEKAEYETGNRSYSKAKEIEAQESVIQSCRRSLNVERQQRMKNKSDSAMSFANVIKELRDPNLRRQIGMEAAMLKYIAEKKYNTMLSKTMTSGQSELYDLSLLFRDGKVPDELPGEFLSSDNNSRQQGE